MLNPTNDELAYLNDLLLKREKKLKVRYNLLDHASLKKKEHRKQIEKSKMKIRKELDMIEAIRDYF